MLNSAFFSFRIFKCNKTDFHLWDFVVVYTGQSQRLIVEVYECE